MGLTPAFLNFSGSPTPLRWRINGEDNVPPEMMICLRALKVRDSCCSGGLASIMLRHKGRYAYGWMKGFGRDSADANGHTVFDDYFINFGVALEV